MNGCVIDGNSSGRHITITNANGLTIGRERDEDMKDKNNVEIRVSDEVIVPEPNVTDIHNFGFNGTVADLFPDEGLVTVVDRDSDFFQIEAGRLEVVPE